MPKLDAKPKAALSDRDLILIGKAVVVADAAATQTGPAEARAEAAAKRLGWTDAAVIAQAKHLYRQRIDAQAYRCWVPLSAMKDGTYFTTPPPTREAMKAANVGCDVKVILPNGKSECWSDASVGKPNPAPTFKATEHQQEAKPRKEAPVPVIERPAAAATPRKRISL